MIGAEFLFQKATKLDVDEKRIASMRIRTVRTAKAVEMRFRPVLMKVARRREPAWEQVDRAA